MSITAEQVQQAAAYLADGGVGEVMQALHLSGEAGIKQVTSDIPLQIALCSMALEHLKNRKQPVRISFRG